MTPALLVLWAVLVAYGLWAVAPRPSDDESPLLRWRRARRAMGDAAARCRRDTEVTS